ncbi:MAG TPA: diguanylate cyclase [Thermohalobaculum sp.]|nr:diguanylate cyclase [Thermohalobaculum sp.]
MGGRPCTRGRSLAFGRSLLLVLDLGRAPVTLSASVGLALTDTPGANADEMVERADRALHEAKNAGGNGFRRAA